MRIIVCDRCRREIQFDFAQPLYKPERFDARTGRYVPIDLCPDCSRDFVKEVRSWFLSYNPHIVGSNENDNP